MNEYLLDTNVVIGLWKFYPSVINNLIKDKKIKILKEVSQELVVKETKEYKGQQVLSERFCRLFPFVIEVDNKNIKEFYSRLDAKYPKKDNAYFDYTNKLSEIDVLLLYTCYSYNNFILATEDKCLFNIANHVLGKDKTVTLKMLVQNEIKEDISD